MVDTKPYKNQQDNHIHHRNLSSVDPIFSAKKSSALEQGGVWFLFPSSGGSLHGGDHSHQDFPQSTAIQMGGVLTIQNPCQPIPP